MFMGMNFMDWSMISTNWGAVCKCNCNLMHFRWNYLTWMNARRTPPGQTIVIATLHSSMAPFRSVPSSTRRDEPNYPKAVIGDIYRGGQFVGDNVLH